jgi:hypothetical protein
MRSRIARAIVVVLSVLTCCACRLGVNESNRAGLGGRDGSAGEGGTSGAGASGAGAAGQSTAGNEGSSGQGAGVDAGASGQSAGDADGGVAGGGPAPDAGSSGSGGSAGSTSELTDCTYDAVQSHADHDYYFCSNYMSWTVARDICADAGGSLVVIDDAAENDFLVGQFGPHPSWWIGANDETTPDAWRWVDGSSNDGTGFCNGNNLCTPAGSAYVNFAVGEPNAISTESCGAIQSAGTWADEYCAVSKPFICESDGEP